MKPLFSKKAFTVLKSVFSLYIFAKEDNNTELMQALGKGIQKLISVYNNKDNMNDFYRYQMSQIENDRKKDPKFVIQWSDDTVTKERQ